MWTTQNLPRWAALRTRQHFVSRQFLLSFTVMFYSAILAFGFSAHAFADCKPLRWNAPAKQFLFPTLEPPPLVDQAQKSIWQYASGRFKKSVLKVLKPVSSVSLMKDVSALKEHFTQLKAEREQLRAEPLNCQSLCLKDFPKKTFEHLKKQQDAKSLFARVKGLWNGLLRFSRRNSHKPCLVIPSVQAQNESDLQAHTQFVTQAASLLEKNHYQHLSLADIFKNHQTEIEAAKAVKEKSTHSSPVPTNAISQVGESALAGTHVIVQALGPKSDDLKALDIATRIFDQALDRLLLEKPKNIRLTSLVPGNDYQLDVIRGISGFALVTVGTVNLGLLPLTAGLSSVISGVATGAVSLAAMAMSHAQKFGHSERNLVFEDKAPQPLKKWSQTVKIAGQWVRASLQKWLKIRPLQVLVLSSMIENYVPIIGSAFQISTGINELYSATFGAYEKGHEALKQYENVYRNIVRTAIHEKKLQIQTQLKQGLELLNQQNQYFSIEDVSQLSCLCESVQWLTQLEAEAAKAFDRRLAYLDQKLAWKHGRERLKKRIFKMFQPASFEQDLSALKDHIAKEKVANGYLGTTYEGLSHLFPKNSPQPKPEDVPLPPLSPEEEAELEVSANPENLNALEPAQKAQVESGLETVRQLNRVNAQLEGAIATVSLEKIDTLIHASDAQESLVQIQDPGIGNPP